jgi:hypothetical protein
MDCFASSDSLAAALVAEKHLLPAADAESLPASATCRARDALKAILFQPNIQSARGSIESNTSNKKKKKKNQT